MPRIAETVYAATEPHRLACEARALLAWPLAARRAYLEDIALIRGEDAAEALRQAVKAQHTAAQNAKRAIKQGWDT